MWLWCLVSRCQLARECAYSTVAAGYIWESGSTSRPTPLDTGVHGPGPVRSVTAEMYICVL